MARDSGDHLRRRRIADLAGEGYEIAVTCRSCGRIALVHPKRLAPEIRDRVTPADIARSGRCSGCGALAPEVAVAVPEHRRITYGGHL
tara:strand:- start:4708 stop:4971 length:264 start_codon:yes stop_codon:yes gene_type:complete